MYSRKNTTTKDINNKTIKMTLLKDPKNLLILLFIALMLSFIFVIARHYHSNAYYQ